MNLNLISTDQRSVCDFVITQSVDSEKSHMAKTQKKKTDHRTASVGTTVMKATCMQLVEDHCCARREGNYSEATERFVEITNQGREGGSPWWQTLCLWARLSNKWPWQSRCLSAYSSHMLTCSDVTAWRAHTHTHTRNMNRSMERIVFFFAWFPG